MAAHTFLNTDRQVVAYVNSLRERNVRSVAVDTEGEFNLHRYGEHLCLIQVYDGTDFIIIDPLNLQTETIRPIFENNKMLKIMFDSSGDRTLLFRKYGIAINPILDLQPAAELLQLEKMDLTYVTRTILGMDDEPKANFQQYNWMLRPIKSAAIEYAIDDVRYLFKLKDALLEEIYEKQLLDEYIRINIEIQTRPIVPNPVPGVFRKGRYRGLSQESKRRFTEIYKIRDGFAKDLDLPPNAVLPNESLFRLAAGHMRAVDINISGRIVAKTADRIKSAIVKVL